jgi:hypothetical protein
MQRQWFFVVVEICLIAVYVIFALFKVSISMSVGLAILALLIFNVGIFQLHSDAAGTTTGFWRPGYSFLLATGLFASALALYEKPATKGKATDDVYMMPRATPTAMSVPTSSEGAGRAGLGRSAAPLSTPAPMLCKVELSGLDALTPGGAAAYDLYIRCPQAAEEVPSVIAPGAPGAPSTVAWLRVKQTYSQPVVEDQGNTYYTFFIVEVEATPLPTGAVHTLFAPEVITKSGPDKKDQDHAFPVLPITIRQTRSIEDVKGLITSVGGALAALMSLLIGLLTFLRGETTNAGK